MREAEAARARGRQPGDPAGRRDPVVSEYLQRQREAALNRQRSQDEVVATKMWPEYDDGTMGAVLAQAPAPAPAPAARARPAIGRANIRVVERPASAGGGSAAQVLAARDARRRAEQQEQEAAAREAGRRIFLENQAAAERNRRRLLGLDDPAADGVEGAAEVVPEAAAADPFSPAPLAEAAAAAAAADPFAETVGAAEAPATPAPPEAPVVVNTAARRDAFADARAEAERNRQRVLADLASGADEPLDNGGGAKLPDALAAKARQSGEGSPAASRARSPAARPRSRAERRAGRGR